MKNLTGESMNITEENLKAMQQLFPEAFEEGKIDFDVLRQLLGDFVDDEQERYSFKWNGKGKALRLSQTPSMGTLRPCKEESKDWDNTENLYIEGDNLEVLKLLQKSYYGKVKMIYIDPPYNTGNDFVYKDDFRDSIENYKELTGQVNDEGDKIDTNTEANGRFHTNWLNMMYPRLRLARNLLTDDGVIFISIDDNEQGNLKRICDEIFGENNLAACIPWQSRLSMQNDTDLSVNHEYLLVYAKKRRLENRRLKEGNVNKWYERDSFVFRPLPLDKAKFDNPDNDPRGLWKADPFDAPNVRPNLTYTVTNPKTGEQHLPPRGRCWRISQEKFSSALDDGRIIFGKSGNGRPQMKSFYSEKKDFGSIDNSWFSGDKIGTTTAASKELQEIFNNIPFDTPKPTSLLKKLLFLGFVQSEDIVMDFFSGSATTAHAVMQLNVEDGGHRKFIMVQIPEPTNEKSEAYKAGYKNICEIGKERIRRAGDKIKAEAGDKAADLDIGFKVFKLDSSNLQKWNPQPDDLVMTLQQATDNFLSDRTEQDVLYEIMLKMGLDLTCQIEEEQAAGETVYIIGGGALMICLGRNITTAVAEAVVKLHEEYESELWQVVFRDTGFASDMDKTNVKETLKAAGLDEDSFVCV